MLDHVSPAGVLVPPRFIPPHSDTRQGGEHSGKMAARWGAGEETLTACNMEFFPIDTLDEAAVLSSGETLEALQSCLDPSILSMLDDSPIIETKDLYGESEATLLTALTEILDNVDDENLSPFDTLPDSDLLSGQKGREHSPLRRLLCLSRSPPERDTLYNTKPSSTGKSMPRILADSLQRSDGEEEEDGSFTLSPMSHDSSPDSDLLDWKGLTLPLPITFEQEEEDGVSVCLGDLVRHMHPYCMSISVENGEGEQVLPEGGILLEVVDQGENGEPILAIPDMALPVTVALKETCSELKVSEEADEADSDSSEHIVVVDDEEISVTDLPEVSPPVTRGVRSELMDRQKEEIREKSPSRRKKRKKSKEQLQPEPVEGRVLRSGRVRPTAQEPPRKPVKKVVKETRREAPKPPTPSVRAPEKPKQTQEVSTTAPAPVSEAQDVTSVSPTQEAAPSHVSAQPSPPGRPDPELSPSRSEDTPGPLQDPPAPSAAPPPGPSDGATAAPGPLTSPMTPQTSEAPPPVAPAAPEPKPKALSLAEYRRLRQQKKPAPVEKQDHNSTKWPSLPEPPKELPPIPCLPDPSPKDPRRLSAQAAKKDQEEVRPAWQPRGPCAPPTPEALLAPPAYMVASNSKAPAATPAPRPQEASGLPRPAPKPQETPQQPRPAPKPQETPQQPRPAPRPQETPQHPRPAPKPQETPQQPRPAPPRNPPAANPVKKFAPHQEVTAQPAARRVPQSSDAPAPVKPVAQVTKCVPEQLKSQPVSADLTKTTTEVIQPTAATASAPRRITVVFPKAPEVTTPSAAKCPPAAAPHPSDPRDPRRVEEEPVVLENKEKPTTALKPLRAKSPTQELIEAFTSEIGIEAADLTSLLEQFEETQAKEEQCVPEVSGRAAAVGNSSVELAPEKTAVERVRANDLSSTAALTPPATPPHQMWKPLTPVALLGKSRAAEASKSSPSKVIQIEARPLPSVRARTKPTPAPPSPPAASVAPEVACMDHDYCLPSRGTSNGESGKRWNVKQQSFITIKPITTPTSPAVPSSSNMADADAAESKAQAALTLDHRTEDVQRSSVLETPDASPSRSETDVTVREASPRRGPLRRSYRQRAASRSPSPRSGHTERAGGRSRKRRSRRSPSPGSSGSESDSHSSSQSRSRSPSKKRYRSYRRDRSSSSSSCSSSRSSPSVSHSPPRRRRYSYSSSCSGSWSRSRSRSRSPQRRAQWSRSRRLNSPPQRAHHRNKTNPEEVKRFKEKAIEERRVVYVGRIRGSMTQRELRDRFSLFGEIEDCTLHFRDHGDNYGFVTYYDTKDAFTAIENGGKLRKSDELPFDLCFGGRRQFCQSSYADLDSSRDYDPLPVKGKFQSLDFDTLLKQAQQNLKR
ncbi:uncharacterized protein pprc1 [Halichoeres trimaculatus]|uniref:uncharacterized protein pprc1 n=1 Tax=Halichoeres trimaculatus TaxID=147232 RepID=UPI003D9F42CC